MVPNFVREFMFGEDILQEGIERYGAEIVADSLN